MKKRRFSLIVLVLGIAGSIALRVLIPSTSGISLTTSKATQYYGWNLVSFWAMIVATIVLSGYSYIARSHR